MKGTRGEPGPDVSTATKLATKLLVISNFTETNVKRIPGCSNDLHSNTLKHNLGLLVAEQR